MALTIPVTLTLAGVVAETSLDAFLAENTFDAGEADTIRGALARGEAYRGGGGASPEWTLAEGLKAEADALDAQLQGKAA